MTQDQANKERIELMQETIQTFIYRNVENLLNQIPEHQQKNIYRTVIDAVDHGLLDTMMKQTKGNQSKAAILLNINRATLRTKLKRQDLL